MKHSKMVMSPIEGRMEFKPSELLVFKPEGTPLVGAEDCWGASPACLEGVEFAMGYVVEPEGARVRLVLEDMYERMLRGQKSTENARVAEGGAQCEWGQV